jgi:hypothetical protein
LLSAKKIAVGKSGQVKASIDTHNLSGPVEKMITLATNDPRHPSVTLSIRVVVEPEIEVSASSISFGNVPAGKEVGQEIILTIPPGKPIKILSAVSKDPNFGVRIEPVPDGTGRQFKLTAKLSASAKPGYHLGQIIVKTDSRLTPEIAIYQSGMVSDAGQ